MSLSPNEPTALPDEIIEPTAAFDVVKESYQPQATSFEPTVESVQFGESHHSLSSADPEQGVSDTDK